MQKLIELREDRNRIVTQMRGILDKAEGEKRNLTAEEQGKYDELFAEQDKRGKAIANEERQMELERSMAETELRRKEDRGGEGGENRGGFAGKRSTEEYRDAFTRFLRDGKSAISVEEYRALQADSPVAGGYLVAPVQFVDTLIKAVDNETFIRAKATKFRVESAAALGAPSLDADPDDADWTAEIKTGNEDGGMSFGARELHPHPLAKRIKISNKLLRSSVLPVDGLAIARLAYKFGITQEKAHLLGSGAGQPLGLFTASAQGISTGRDVSTDNTATAITMDGLLNAKYSLKGQYQKTAEWLFHRDGVKMVSKLKDNDGQYLWQPSKREGEPDMLAGRPVNMSEYVPNTFTTGLYVGMFGDFSHYWIADAMDLQIQVLKELYAETNQTGYIGRLESDGMPVLEEAFARIKLG